MQLLVSIWVLAAVACGVVADAVAADAPNIVYVVADDLGWKDVGFHGSDIRTPSLDQLAAGGTRLEEFIVQPMCTPTRAALLTGRYPLRYGLQTVVIPSAGLYGLPTDEWLLPQALKAAGYRTAIVGKWHLGHADRKFWPRQRGFDYQYGPLLGEIDYFTKEAHGRRDWFRDDVPVADEGYVTSLLGADAVRLIETHDPKTPLFLYLAFTAPHAPYQAPETDLESYATIRDPARRAYAAMITAMDREIGRVVDALDRRGMRGNTLIVFHSDNGGPRSARMTGEVDTSGSPIPCDNGPYRDGKGSLYEGGTRVVAIANWPGHVPAGVVVDEAIHVVDMYPTLVGLAGGTTKRAKPLDGVDVWTTIADGRPSPRTEIVYNVEPMRAAIQQDGWKLVWRATLPARTELFDMTADPGEQRNLAAVHPDRVAALQQRAQQLAADSVPPLFMEEALGAATRVLMGSTSLPTAEDEKALELQP